MVQNIILCSPDPYKGALKNLTRNVLYFDTLDNTGIGTLLVDEDDIKRDITTAQRQMMSAAHWPADVSYSLAN